MILTNKHNLPRPIYDAVANDPYSKGEADFSVTELIKPPQARALTKLFWDHPDMREDAVDRVWSLFGQATHHILERGNAEGHIKEERHFWEVDGATISGAVDLYTPTNRIQDYKVTSVFSYQMGMKADWVAQLSIYAQMVRSCKGLDVSGADIVAILRDWQRREAVKPDYPDAQVVVIEVPLWGEEQTMAYVKERIAKHREAESFSNPELLAGTQPCTDEERWHRPDSWAVKKVGNKKAFRVKATREEADGVIESLGKSGKDYEVEFRQGRDVRCENFCLAKRWCHQYQSAWGKEGTEAVAG